jgi:hypothetical protein
MPPATDPGSRLLAFRPAAVIRRLPPRSEACPLSPRELLRGWAPGLPTIPVVRAGSPAAALGALVAARQLDSALGLSLPAGQSPEPWFGAVARAADEVAARLPLFLWGEVPVDGESGEAVERARREAWRLVEGGLTVLAFAVDRVPEGGRAAALLGATEAAREHEVAVELLLPAGPEGLPSGPSAAALLEDLRAVGLRPDLLGVRFPPAEGGEQVRAHGQALEDLCAWVEEVPVMRRGPLAPGGAPESAARTLAACEDGGAIQAASGRREAPPAAPPLEAMEGPEARAYFAAVEFLEALGAAGSAARLEQRILDLVGGR